MVGVYEYASVLDIMEFEEELSMPGWPSSFVMWLCVCSEFASI
jgi:hypothetical protein